MDTYPDVDAVKSERQLLQLALTYQDAKTTKSRPVRARLTSMIAGKAWKVICRTYRVESNRLTIWREWRKNAGANLLD